MQVESIFDNMVLSNRLASDAEAKKWMLSRSYFKDVFKTGEDKSRCFEWEEGEGTPIDGCKTVASMGAEEEREFFRADFETSWSRLPYLEKSLVLNKIADAFEKNVEILSVLESMSIKSVVHRVRNEVLPFCIRQFRYFRSVLLLDNEKKRLSSNRRIFLCFPVFASLSDVVTKLAPALCSGNDVRIFLYRLQSEAIRNENLALFFLFELLDEFGEIKDVVKFFYSTKPIIEIFDRALFLGKMYQFHLNFVVTNQESLLISKKIPYLSVSSDHWRMCVVAFDSCDLDGAVEAVVRSLSRAAERFLDFRLLVQVGAFRTFVRRLARQLESLRVGVCLDETADLGPLSGLIKSYIWRLEEMEESNVRELRCDGFEVLSFRTAKEATELADDSLYDVRASIWTWDLSLAHEVSHKVSASTVWVNCFGVYDPVVPVANFKLGGNCVDGGEFGVQQFENFLEPVVDLKDTTDFVVVPSIHSKSWASLSPFRRSEIFLSAFEDLMRQKVELKSDFNETNGSDFESFVEDFGFWASKCSLVDAVVHTASFNGHVIVTSVPIGSILFTVGLLHPLKLFVNFALAAVAFGNMATVTVAEGLIPLFTKVQKVLTSRGLPLGILKVIDSQHEPIPSDKFDAHFVLDFNYSLRRPLGTGKFPIVIKYYEDEGFWIDVDRIRDDRFRRSLISKLTRPKTVWFSSGVSFAK